MGLISWIKDRKAERELRPQLDRVFSRYGDWVKRWNEAITEIIDEFKANGALDNHSAGELETMFRVELVKGGVLDP